MDSLSDSAERVLQVLHQVGGVGTSTELQTRLGLSQPTVSRALAALIKQGRLLKVGAARSQQYLLPRHIEGVGSQIGIVRVDTQGRVSPFANMVALSGGRFWVNEADGLTQIHDGLPWFLDDMRPQGFMGQTFVQNHPELSLPVDLRHWNDDHALKAMVLAGDDLPGNLIVGEQALARYLSGVRQIAVVQDPEVDYPKLAMLAMQGAQPGSSAGGEQPKFSALINGQAMLVKFSPSGDAPGDQRSRDLLVCEHLALRTLAAAGLPAAESQIVIAGGRVFLQSKRFDRTEKGRIGMVSLLAYDAQYVGEMDNWSATAQRMSARQLMTSQDAQQLQLLEAYGLLIANTDRHYGNISFLLEDDDWRLSPTYDMLPMFYAPVKGELVERDFASRKLQPTSHTLAVWPQAKQLAQQFWQSVAADARVSDAFKALAQANADVVAKL
ncbi:MAG: type II toxin-antitoxin system HipA family toxin YjjJ [Burkholderiales bacterium]|nr:type II toxin-antitoxin system HipA family toxin YjjJ [Burkholderiales bacterium]